MIVLGKEMRRQTMGDEGRNSSPAGLPPMSSTLTGNGYGAYSI